jgi:hypothetical protein
MSAGGAPRMRARIARWAAIACAALAAACGTPSRDEAERAGGPLRLGESRTRFEVRVHAAEFADRIADTADRIAAADDTPAVREAALRWKLGATEAALRAGLRPPGALALVDSWALARQQLRLLDGGAAGRAFGARQPVAIETARGLAEDAEALAARLLDPGTFEAYRALVDAHAERHPVTELGFGRASIAGPWLKAALRSGDVPHSLGALGDILSDATDRGVELVRRLPDLVRWRGELSLFEHAGTLQGIGRVVDAVDRELGEFATLAREQPERLAALLERAGAEARSALSSADRRWLQALDALRADRGPVWQAVLGSDLVQGLLKGIAYLLLAVLAAGFALGWVGGRWLLRRRVRRAARGVSLR